VKRTINIWNGIDKISIVLFLLMVTMGWFNIYAAVFNEERSGILDMSQRYGKQFIWIIASLVLAVFVVIIDNRFYFFFSWFIYGALMLLLILVLIFGSEINGARSWFEFGGLNLQPSEFAKFGTALGLAGYLNSKRQDLTKLQILFSAAAIILFPAILTSLQPDLGSTIVYFALFIVLFREGMSPYIFVTGLLMIILFFLTLIINNLYLTGALVVIAILLVWFATRKWKLVLVGATIFILIAGGLYVLNYYIFKIIGNEMVIFISIILSGIAFAYYIYNRKAGAVLIIYLFLLGSVIYVN
jgi:rod shape determining protein RodA